MPPKLILASTSPARKRLLAALGIPFDCISPDIEEQVPSGMTAQAATRALSRQKAEAVYTRYPEAWIIGADQLVSFNQSILHKPTDQGEARAQLAQLNGATHEITTSVTLLRPGNLDTRTDTVQLAMRALSDGEIEDYLATGEWQGCVGSYRIEGRGQSLFRAVGGDGTSVQGLPMALVVEMMRCANFPSSASW